jgi:hypothetical protein
MKSLEGWTSLRRLARSRAAILIAVVALPVVVATQSAPAGFRNERPIVTTGPGPYRLGIDVPLLVGAGERALDLRLFDATNREVPYLFVRPPRTEPRWSPGVVLPVASTKTTSGFEVDFRQSARINAIKLGGMPTGFLKRAVIEGSGDRSRWTLLVAEGTLFDLPAEQLVQLELSFTPGEYRYLRVTWDDTNSGRVPVPRFVDARRVTENAPAPRLRAAVAFEKRVSEPGRSRYLVRLPGAHLPITALILEVDADRILREAEVSESRLMGGEAVPVSLGRMTLRRAVVGNVAASALRIPVNAPAEPQVDLTIEDGDNPPLAITTITAEFTEQPWIYFEAGSEPIVARYGSANLTRPQYDLEAARDSLRIDTVRDAAWGEPRPLPQVEDRTLAPMPLEGAPIDAARFRHVRDVPAGDAGLVALPMDAAALAESTGPARGFADVRVIDAEGRQVPYLVERRGEPLSVDLTLTSTTSAAVNSENGRRSVYRITLPFQQLPPARLVLTTDARVFDRRLVLGIEHAPDRHRREPWFEEIAVGRWVQADRERAAVPLTLPIRTVDTTDLLLVVDEGDNRALTIATPHLLLPSYRLRFYRPATTALRLAYGRDDLAPPRYDLALLAPQVLGVAATEIAVGGVSATPVTSHRPLMLASPVVFWSVLGVAVVVLLGFVVRLVGKVETPAR